MDELAELKEKFIIEMGKYEKENLAELVKRTMNFCVVDKSGKVVITFKRLTDKEQIKIALIARFLASELTKGNIPREVTAEELVLSLKQKKSIIAARLKEIKDEGDAERLSRGTYTITSYKLTKMLDELEKKILSKK
ncbi:hypothetical protein HY991_00235 [Candidatus Micrarchaeota archaeon]|nr:hypothetical protein [Candidatus Micrarchaeota archaeon]